MRNPNAVVIWLAAVLGLGLAIAIGIALAGVLAEHPEGIGLTGLLLAGAAAIGLAFYRYPRRAAALALVALLALTAWQLWRMRIDRRRAVNYQVARVQMQRAYEVEHARRRELGLPASDSISLEIGRDYSSTLSSKVEIAAALKREGVTHVDTVEFTLDPDTLWHRKRRDGLSRIDALEYVFTRVGSCPRFRNDSLPNGDAKWLDRGDDMSRFFPHAVWAHCRR